MGFLVCHPALERLRPTELEAADGAWLACAPLLVSSLLQKTRPLGVSLSVQDECISNELILSSQSVHFDAGGCFPEGDAAALPLERFRLPEGKVVSGELPFAALRAWIGVVAFVDCPSLGID